jgi:hypothetical protein
MELICFLPVFNYFGQAAFVKKRPFLWAFERQKTKRSQPSAAPTPIPVGAAEGCDLLILC